MKKQYSQFIVPKWTKLTLLSLLIISVLFIVYSISIYQDIQKNKLTGFSKSEQLAVSETDLVSIDKVTRFHGEQYYHVVSGTTQVGDSAVAYVPVDEDQQIKFYNTEELIKQEEMIRTWQENCSSCELISINLAIDNDQPLWEIKYIDNNDRYVFEYFSLEKGLSYEHYRLRQSLY